MDIIDNFKLYTDKPLDNRYVVNSIYDVSNYWYNGMQMYEPSSNMVWVVRNAQIPIIEPLLFDFDIIDGGSNWSNPTTSSVSGGTW